MARKAEKPTRSMLQAEAIYASFSREEEQGFLFSGGANPMPELLYVEKGSLHSVADGRKLHLQQGDFVIYGADQWHMQYADTGISPRCLRIFFEIKGDLSPLLNRKFAISDQTEALLQQLLREQERSEIYADEMILALLNQLILLLIRQAAREPIPDR